MVMESYVGMRSSNYQKYASQNTYKTVMNFWICYVNIILD